MAKIVKDFGEAEEKGYIGNSNNNPASSENTILRILEGANNLITGLRGLQDNRPKQTTDEEHLTGDFIITGKSEYETKPITTGFLEKKKTRKTK